MKELLENIAKSLVDNPESVEAVSYTHLDVYKRQRNTAVFFAFFHLCRAYCTQADKG